MRKDYIFTSESVSEGHPDKVSDRISDMVVDHFAEEEPGNWYRQPRLYKCVAPTPRADLITNEEHNNISRWMEE